MTYLVAIDINVNRQKSVSKYGTAWIWKSMPSALTSILGRLVTEAYSRPKGSKRYWAILKPRLLMRDVGVNEFVVGFGQVHYTFDDSDDMHRH